MVYYNFFKLLKNLLYYFSKTFKYISICLLAFCFIAICLLLMSNNSKAETLTDDNYTFEMPDEILESYYNSPFYNDNYYSILWKENYPNSSIKYKACFVPKTNIDFYFYFIDGSSSDHVVTDGIYENRIIACSFVPSNSYIYNDLANSPVVYSSYSGRIMRYYDRSSNGNIYVWGSADSLKINNSFVDFPGPFIAPEVSFPHNNGTTDYISGEFRDFLIIGNSAESLYFNFNDSSVVGTDTYLKYVHLLLDSNSPYLLNNYEHNSIYIIPKNILGDYLDGHIYNLQLEWSNNGVTSFSSMYSWTTNFSDQAILNDEIERQSKIESGINDINGFLNDNSYNKNDILDNMPNSDDYISPTDSGIDNLFNTFRNAFTSSQTQTVRFVFPNSNGQYIDIRSDLVTSKIPQPILILIQTFYWYVICRYIIKDIANTAEKAKSGEILDNSSDGNIKTDLL